MFHSIPCSFRLLIVAALAAVAPLLVVADDAVPSREDVAAGSVSATVTAVDRPSRSIVLKFEDGREEAFVVDDQIEGFSDLSVGDTVLAGYARWLAMELRPPTAAELENPLDVTEQIEGLDSPDGTARVGRMIRAVTTIEVLDRINMTATLKGPLGNYLTIDVEDAELMTEVNIGQTVVATFTEAVIVSLAKVE